MSMHVSAWLFSVCIIAYPTSSSVVDDVIAERSYDAVRFFKSVLLPAILQVDAGDRVTLVLYALSAVNPDLLDAVRDSLCVPVSRSGETLKSPSQLVHPTTEQASLYSPEEERFPHGGYMRPKALASLRELGMATDRITWEDSIEQSASVSHVDHQTARVSDDLPDPQHLIDFRPVTRGGVGGFVRTPLFANSPSKNTNPPPPQTSQLHI